MNSSDSLHNASLKAFLIYSEDWFTETVDELSLSKFSIGCILKEFMNLPDELQTESHLSPFLRLAAIRRENNGASKFLSLTLTKETTDSEDDLYRDFTLTLPDLVELGRMSVIYSDSKLFRRWSESRKVDAVIDASRRDLLEFSEYADEFLQLAIDLTKTLRAYRSIAQELPINLIGVVNSVVYFDLWDTLMDHAKWALTKVASSQRGDPMDFVVSDPEKSGILSKPKKAKSFGDKSEIDPLGDDAEIE